MLDAFRRAVADREAELLALWERVVNVDSGSYCKAGVDALGRLMAGELAPLGFSTDVIEETACGSHVLCRRIGQGRGRLFLSMHLDTVWPEGTVAEWPFRLDRGRATGPGVADMKGGWIVMLGALHALGGAGLDRLAQTTVLMTGDEELGSVRGRPHIERIAGESDWTLVMESAKPDGSVTVGRTAVGALYLTIRGRSAHVANDYRLGRNAIEEAAHVILALHALTDPDAERIVNVGIVRGGSARQVVADHVWLSVDLRAPDNPTADALVARIREIAAAPRTPGVTIEVEGGVTRPAWVNNPGTRRLAELAADIAREGGLPFGEIVSRGGSDGSFTGALGVPTLDGLGIVGGNVCSRHEWADAASLVPRAALLATLIARLAEPSTT